MIAIRKLDFTPTSEDVNKAEQFILANIGRPYEEEFSQLGTAVCDGPCYVCCNCTIASCISREEAARTMFCSEAVAGMLQQLGPLSNAYPPSRFSPGDLGETTGPCWWLLGCQANSLPMARGASYRRDVVLKNPALTGGNWDEYWPKEQEEMEKELTRRDIAALRSKHSPTEALPTATGELQSPGHV